MKTPYRIETLSLFKTISPNHTFISFKKVQKGVDFLNDFIAFKALPCAVYCHGNKLFTKDYFNSIISEIYSDTDLIFYDTLNNKFTDKQNTSSELTFFSFKEFLSTISFFRKKDEMIQLGIPESVINDTIELAGEHAQTLYDLSTTFILNQTMSEKDFLTLISNTEYN